MNLIPMKGCVVVELVDTYELATSPDKQYATKNKGIVVAVPDDEDDQYLMGTKVWFESYKDDATETVDGKEYSAIKVREIRMYSVKD